MKISILTATYNRGEMLKRLYKSIKENAQKDVKIEWIIIDDGSTDKTKEIVNNFTEEKNLEIKYEYQQNSGKMSAINKGVEIATGDLIMDCDSDDYLENNAISKIKENADML